MSNNSVTESDHNLMLFPQKTMMWQKKEKNTGGNTTWGSECWTIEYAVYKVVSKAVNKRSLDRVVKLCWGKNTSEEEDDWMHLPG